jgi:uncharacterized protein (TIGR02646 family)
MIRIHRPRKAPDILGAASTRVWAKEWAMGRRKDWASPSAKKALRRVLGRMTRGKCTYCESVLEVTSYLEVDHYHPKSRYPSKAYTWSNLFPACRVCNGAKGDSDHKGSLLKPDVEDPEPFFWVNPDSGELEPHPSLDDAGRHRADETIRICKLQRGGLRSLRLETLESVGRWLNRASDLSHLTGALQAELDCFLDPSTPYKLVIRHTLTIRGKAAFAERDRRKSAKAV